MTCDQTLFRTALLDAAQPVPDGLVGRRDEPAGRRFSVYRNNVVVALRDALRTAFPLVRKLIGAQNFDALADLYLRSHPPSSPIMMYYGDSFPSFIKGFEPLAHIGYLADCARLDLAFRHSYHARDAAPLDPQTLPQDPEALASARLSLHPATRLIRSKWPLYDIWRFNMVENAPKPRAIRQSVLVTREEFDPAPFALPGGALEWFNAIATNHRFYEAQEMAEAADPAFDLTETLTLALTAKALTSPAEKDP